MSKKYRYIGETSPGNPFRKGFTYTLIEHPIEKTLKMQFLDNYGYVYLHGDLTQFEEVQSYEDMIEDIEEKLNYTPEYKNPNVHTIYLNQQFKIAFWTQGAVVLCEKHLLFFEKDSEGYYKHIQQDIYKYDMYSLMQSLSNLYYCID